VSGPRDRGTLRRVGPVLPLRVWLILSYLFVLALPVLALIGTGALARDLRDQTRWDLEHQGAIVARLAAARAGDGEIGEVGAALSEELRALKATTLTGYRILDRDGRVVASSAEDDPRLGEVVDGPHLARALAGGEGVAIEARPPGAVRAPLTGPSRRASVRVGVAVPIRGGSGEVIGAVALSRTPREELQTLVQMGVGRLLFGGLVALGLTVALALAWGHLLSRGLRALAVASHRIADGDLTAVDALDRPRDSHVAEVGRVARASATMARRLAARLAYIGEFSGNVAHEFKTPLTTLRGTLELVGDEPDMEASQRARLLGNATASIDHLERLVSGLLALARAEEGGARAPVDLDAVARAVAADRGVPVEGGAGSVVGDAAQLTTAIGNLVDNARRHGGPAVRIVAGRSEGRAVVEVHDDGPGISPANLERAFERFFTTRRGEGGTGLGLALVRTIAEAHGGTATLTSGPGGTVARMTLPAARP
jgi:signal transduction histidine kinase